MGKNCPEAEELRQFLSGVVDAGARSRLQAHVESCKECESRLNEISRNAMTLPGPALEQPANPSTMLRAGESQSERTLRRVNDLFGDQTLDASADPGRATDTLVRIPGYKVLRVIAQGGMGIVLQARQDVLDRLVAIKLPLSGAVGTAQERE